MYSAKWAAFLGAPLYLTYLPSPESSLPDEPLLYQSHIETQWNKYSLKNLFKLRKYRKLIKVYQTLIKTVHCPDKSRQQNTPALHHPHMHALGTRSVTVIYSRRIIKSFHQCWYSCSRAFITLFGAQSVFLYSSLSTQVTEVRLRSLSDSVALKKYNCCVLLWEFEHLSLCLSCNYCIFNRIDFFLSYAKVYIPSFCCWCIFRNIFIVFHSEARLSLTWVLAFLIFFLYNLRQHQRYLINIYFILSYLKLKIMHEEFFLRILLV